MDIPHDFLYPSTPARALEVQKELSSKVIVEDQFGPLTTIAGVDVSNTRFDPTQMVYASAVVLSYPDFSLMEEATLAEKQSFPYIPGLLGFRESPSLVKTLSSLKTWPDLILVDGQGLSHPRGFGIACQLGVILDIPTIGVAKSILVGKPEMELGETPGSQTNLIYKEKRIGILLRTKARSNPLIIAPGHKVSFETAVNIVQSCLRRYRLPEPTRFAHHAANKCRKQHLQQMEST